MCTCVSVTADKVWRVGCEILRYLVSEEKQKHVDLKRPVLQRYSVFDFYKQYSKFSLLSALVIAFQLLWEVFAFSSRSLIILAGTYPLYSVLTLCQQGPRHGSPFPYLGGDA